MWTKYQLFNWLRDTAWGVRERVREIERKREWGGSGRREWKERKEGRSRNQCKNPTKNEKRRDSLICKTAASDTFKSPYLKAINRNQLWELMGSSKCYIKHIGKNFCFSTINTIYYEIYVRMCAFAAHTNALLHRLLKWVERRKNSNELMKLSWFYLWATNSLSQCKSSLPHSMLAIDSRIASGASEEEAKNWKTNSNTCLSMSCKN